MMLCVCIEIVSQHHSALFHRYMYAYEYVTLRMTGECRLIVIIGIAYAQCNIYYTNSCIYSVYIICTYRVERIQPSLHFKSHFVWFSLAHMRTLVPLSLPLIQFFSYSLCSSIHIITTHSSVCCRR